MAEDKSIPKEERRGFGVTPKVAEEEMPVSHPGWEIFLQHYQPATHADGPELVTTCEILDRLNNIVYYEYLDEPELFRLLLKSGFSTRRVADMALWMLRPAVL